MEDQPIDQEEAHFANLLEKVSQNSDQLIPGNFESNVSKTMFNVREFQTNTIDKQQPMFGVSARRKSPLQETPKIAEFGEPMQSDDAGASPVENYFMANILSLQLTNDPNQKEKQL